MSGNPKTGTAGNTEKDPDDWVSGDEPAVVIEFDFEGDTARRTGMPDAHRH